MISRDQKHPSNQPESTSHVFENVYIKLLFSFYYYNHYFHFTPFFLPVHCGIWRLEGRRQFSWTILVTACVWLCPRTTTPSFLVLATLWPSCGTSGMASASKPSRVTRVTSTPFQWVYTKCLIQCWENAEENIAVIFWPVISFFIGDPSLLPVSKIWVFSNW